MKAKSCYLLIDKTRSCVVLFLITLLRFDFLQTFWNDYSLDPFLIFSDRTPFTKLSWQSCCVLQLKCHWDGVPRHENRSKPSAFSYVWVFPVLTILCSLAQSLELNWNISLLTTQVLNLRNMSSLYHVEYLIKNVFAYIFASRTPAVRVDQICKKLLGIYSNYLVPFS